MDPRPCPICGLPARTDPSNPDRPFCSRTCRLVDLDRWLSGDYRVPGPPVDPEAIEPDPPTAPE
jgi:endogenous inhibitor of DNA gyrase (YacG/DUF329 family)